MFDRLGELASEHAELERALADPGLHADPDKARELMVNNDFPYTEIDVLAAEALHERGEVLDAISSRDDVDHQGFLNRLTRIARLELGEFPVALAQQRSGTPTTC